LGLSKFFAVSDANHNSSFGLCDGFRKANVSAGGVQIVWTDDNNRPCRVQYSNGKKIDFANFTAIGGDSVFTDFTNWNCPAPFCNSVGDYMWVLDASGSVASPEYAAEFRFATSFASNHTFGPGFSSMGLVTYAPARLGFCSLCLQLTVATGSE
jgi:hypothetical protein